MECTDISSEELNTLRERFCRFRSDLGVKYTTTAAALQWGESTLRNFANGRTRLSTEKYNALCAYLKKFNY